MKLTIKTGSNLKKVVELSKDLEFDVSKGEQYIFSSGFSNYILNFEDNQQTILLVFNVDGKTVKVQLKGIVPLLNENTPNMENPTAVIINKNVNDKDLDELIENSQFSGSEIIDRLEIIASRPVETGTGDNLALITNFQTLIESLDAAAAGPEAGEATGNGSTFNSIFGSTSDNLNEIAPSDQWVNLTESISSIPVDPGDTDPVTIPGIVVSDSAVNEEDGVLTFTISLSNPSSQIVSVDYTTADGTAVEGSDYLGTVGTITFAPGETSKTISVPVVNDDVYEDSESMYVNLSNAVNAEISDEQGEGRISDESDKPSISVSGTEVVEGGYAVFNIQLSNPSTQDVIFDLTPKEGTAKEDEDYVPVVEVSYDGGVTWEETTEGKIPAGETEILARVKTTQDDIDEPVEEFKLEATVTSGNTTNEVTE
ncbi:Calx-beta domain-containing protein, partial [Malaciobacter pacificus]